MFPERHAVLPGWFVGLVTILCHAEIIPLEHCSLNRNARILYWTLLDTADTELGCYSELKKRSGADSENIQRLTKNEDPAEPRLALPRQQNIL